MDLSTEVHDRKFTTELFDKRHPFTFYINRIPYLQSNVSSNIFYVSIGSEILRIDRTITEIINMVEQVNLLLKQMKKHIVNVFVSFHC